LNNGQAQHPYVGVAVAQLTPDIARTLQLAVTTGVLVRDVTPGGPAAKAGVQPGDVVTTFGSTKTNMVEDFLSALRRTKLGRHREATDPTGRGQSQSYRSGDAGRPHQW
jgi:S1-C subfamily serine protease